MKSLLSYGRLPDFEAVIRRFPVAMLAAVALAVLLAWTGFRLIDEHTSGFAAGLVLAFYTSTLVQLGAESRGKAGLAPNALKLAVGALVILLCTYWKPLAFVSPLAIAGAVVFLGNAAFWRRSRDDRGVWVFTQKLWTGAIFAAVGSAIFTAGTFAIVAALKSLFGIDIEDVATHAILPLGLAVLAPAYWLGTLPHVGDIATTSDAEISFEARALGFLGTWILAPLTLIYGVIVLAYALRILVSWDLPKGEIAQLVTPFIAIGTFTWLVLEPSVIGKGPLIRLFRRVWFPIALVATAMLLIAVGARVAEYGLTTERNLLLAFAVAAAILGLWFAVKPTSDIRIPTATAAGFFILSAFVARPAGDLSQLLRLRAALSDNESSAVFATVQHLVRQDRDDWVRDLLPGAPGGAYFNSDWRSFLVERGYTPEIQATAFRTATFATPLPIDLVDMEQLVMRGTIFVDNRRMSANDKSTDRLEYGNGDLVLFLSGVETVVPMPRGFDDLYMENAIENQTRRGRETDLSVLAPVDLTLSDGRRARLVFIELSLHGEADELSGGYGQALLFAE